MMKKKKILLLIVSFVLIILLVFGIFLIGKNKLMNTNYEQLNPTDKKMLTEYNRFYSECLEENIWKDFNLEKKTILTISKDTLNTYLINPTNIPKNIFSKKIDMPNDFKLQSVYRIAPVTPQILKIKLDFVSDFNTIAKNYSVFDNDVYFIKYDNETSFEMKNQSSHFTPLLVHESFHYYMQNDWKQYARPNNKLNDEGMELFKKQYVILDQISNAINSNVDKKILINYAQQYVEIVSKRIKNNEQYVLLELAHETAEGSAQYLSIKAAKIVGYDLDVMYFDNVTNVPFSDVFNQIQAGNLGLEFLANRMPYETGAQLCQLFDALNIPNWQEKLNNQTIDKPVYLYDILKEYLADI